MSAFLCTDTQFAVVAKFLFDDAALTQSFADGLKRENNRSVNYRYKEHLRFRSVKLSAVSDADLAYYTMHDALRLLVCIDYQSCEHPTYNKVPYELASSLLIARGARISQSSVWSI
jgi:hypothetical protein